jgi:hypothetical protein
MTAVFIRRKIAMEDTDPGRHCVTREAETGVMQLQAKKCQGWRASTRN